MVTSILAKMLTTVHSKSMLLLLALLLGLLLVWLLALLLVVPNVWLLAWLLALHLVWLLAWLLAMQLAWLLAMQLAWLFGNAVGVAVGNWCGCCQCCWHCSWHCCWLAIFNFTWSDNFTWCAHHVISNTCEMDICRYLILHKHAHHVYLIICNIEYEFCAKYCVPKFDFTRPHFCV